MSRTSARKSNGKGTSKKGSKPDEDFTFDDDFTDEKSIDEYNLKQLKAMATTALISGRSKLDKQGLYNALLEKFQAGDEEDSENEEEEEGEDEGSADNGSRPKMLSEDEVNQMSNKELKKLATELQIPNRSKAKNHDEYVKLVLDFYKSGKANEPRKSAPKGTTKFDPTKEPSYYSKRQLYDMGKKKGLPVTKAMNHSELYYVLKQGKAPEEFKEKQKKSQDKRKSAKKSTASTKPKTLDDMTLQELKCQALTLGIPTNRKTKDQLIKLISDHEKEANKAGPSKKSSPSPAPSPSPASNLSSPVKSSVSSPKSPRRSPPAATFTVVEDSEDEEEEPDAGEESGEEYEDEDEPEPSISFLAGRG